MSVDSRSPIISLRRSKKEPEHLDYSEPDFSSWAARLADYTPPTQTVTAETPAPETPAPEWAARLADYTPSTQTVAASTPSPQRAAAATAPVVATATAVAEKAGAPVLDDRPSLEEVLEKLLSFDGAMCVAIVDSETGMILGKAGSGVDIDLAAAGASTILRARLASTKALGTNEKIDDLLISLTTQVQIIHPLPSNPSIFTYLIGDKAKASLAMARYKATEADLQIQL
jgi:predicted regulator of Ras-like GTPase activity (Roadblock/LC7/MglB family)